MNGLRGPRIDKILVIGKQNNQIDLKTANASNDIRQYLKPSKGTEVGIMSYDFPKDEWSNEWLNWLRYQETQNDVSFRVIGGPLVQAKEELNKLLDEKMIMLRLCPTLETFHVLYAKEPKQLWIEQHHMTQLALGVHYTANPLESVWCEALNYFNTIWNASMPVERV